MHSGYWYHLFQTTATHRPHCKVWTWNGPLLCFTCRSSMTTCWLEWPRRRPRQTWTWIVENDLKPANIGLHTAWRRPCARSCWLEELREDTNAPLGACYWWWRWWWWDMPPDLYSKLEEFVCQMYHQLVEDPIFNHYQWCQWISLQSLLCEVGDMESHQTTSRHLEAARMDYQ